MSIFSKIKGAKKAADQHKETKPQDSEEPKKVAYRHVPTHAAIDALSGAPSSWKEEDRAAIRIQNHRRISRNNSDLSFATSINTSINRNASYNSSDAPSSQASRPRMQTRRSHLGFQGYDGYSSQRPNLGKSPLASNQISPAGSSGNSVSSSSSQILELPNIHKETNSFDYASKTPPRKLGEAPLFDVAPDPKPATPTQFTPIAPKKKGWGKAFSKKSNAIAAH